MSDAKLTVANDHLSIKQVFNARIEHLFACFTQPDLLSQWHAPGQMTVPDLSVDLKVGGNYRISMKNAEGQIFTAYGVYKEIIEPTKLVYTWSWEHTDGPETTVTILLTDLGERTEVELLHEGFAAPDVAEHHSQGWTGIFTNLSNYLNS